MSVSVLPDSDAYLYAKLISTSGVSNEKPDRVVVVGTGHVGSQIAYLLTENAIASEIVLISGTGNFGKACAEAKDIQQSNPLLKHPVRVRGGDYPDVKDAKCVIITVGTARDATNKDGRMALAQPNVKIMKAVANKIKRNIRPHTKCKFIIVSNPVDVMTYAFIQYTGLSYKQVIGTGTMLDTLRLTTLLAMHFKVAPKDITAIALGEHGETVVVPWSHINVKGISADALLNAEQKQDIEAGVVSSAKEIIKEKGYTNYAIAAVTCELCGDMLKGAEGFGRVRTVSVLNPKLNRTLESEDITACISFPCRIGPTGINKIYYGHELGLNKEELRRFKQSAEAISTVTKKVLKE